MSGKDLQQKRFTTNSKKTVKSKSDAKEDPDSKNENASVNDNKTQKKDRQEIYLYLNLVIRMIRLYSALKLIPLVWNEKRRRVETTDSPFSYFIWFYCVQITTIVFIYGTWRLIKEIFDPSPNFQGYKIIVYMLYDLCLCILLVYNYTLIFRQRMTLQLFNTYIKTEFALTDILDKKGYEFGEDGLKAYRYYRTSLLSLTIVFWSVNWLMPLQTVLVDTDLDPLQRFLMEHFPPDFVESTWIRGPLAVGMFIVLMHIGGSSFIAGMALITFATRINHYISFILLEDEKKLLLGDPRSAVKMHIYLDYICKSINVWGSFVAPAIIFLGNIIHTMIMFTAIKLSSVIPMPGTIYFPISAIMFGIFELQFLPKSGEMYDRSSMATSVWAEQPMDKASSKEIRTMVPFGLSAHFFWMKKGTAVTFFQTAVNNTIDMCLGIKI